MYSFNPFRPDDSQGNQDAAAMPATFQVFKTRKGLRWLAISSNNYEDKDREIVSRKALESDVARTAADGMYGPLRWWHVGEPNPLDPKAPWGRGVDLGGCDFAAMDGPWLIESGTFASPAIGDAIAAKAPQLALSIGFFHPKGEPDADGVFHHIRRFERSLAPAGKVSNPLTALYVPNGGTSMPMHEQQLKALTDLLGEKSPSEIQALIDGFTSQATTKAQAQGLRYKAETTDDPAAMIAQIEAELSSLKADMRAPDEEVEIEDEMDSSEEEPYSGDMPLSQFKQIMTECVKAAMNDMHSEMKALNTRMGMAEKMGAMMEEMKAMFGGQATKTAKEAGDRIVALEQQIATLKAAMIEMNGDTPRALKSAADSARTALPADAPAPGDTFRVEKAGQPVYRNPADGVGAWLEGVAAD